MGQSGHARRSLDTIALLLGFLVALVGLACAADLRPPPTSTAAPVPPPALDQERVPNFGHVFIIVMENKEYEQIIGSPDAPYLNQLARHYAVAGSYFAVRHPSLPNYLALVSGSTQGMTNDCGTCSFDAPNLVDQLEARGKSWTSYEEDLPAPCFNGDAAGTTQRLVHGYARRHDPLMYFHDVAQDPARCRRVVPLTGFADDLRANRVTDFVWITPNLIHDMHDGSVDDGDAWLASFVPKILASSAWKDNGVLFIVWDEGVTNAGCCGNAAGGHVPALVIASSGLRGYVSAVPYSHYSLLRTIEDAWGLGHLAHAADPGTVPMADFFAP